MISKSTSSTLAAYSRGVHDGSRRMLRVRAKLWHQASSTRSSSTGMPSITAWKFSMRRRCQPGSKSSANPSGVGRLARTPIGDGVRWNTWTRSAASARWGRIWIPDPPTPIRATVLPASLSRPPSWLPPVTS